MEKEEFEELSKVEQAYICGGAWVYVDGEWIWVEDVR